MQRANGRRPARLAIGQAILGSEFRGARYGGRYLRSAASAMRSAEEGFREPSGANAPAGNQPAEANGRSLSNDCGRAGARLLNGALPVMPLRIANIVMAAAL